MNKKLSGTIEFDGRLIINIGRTQYKLLNDPECELLIDADPWRKAIILTRDGLWNSEVQVGYIQHVSNRLFVERSWASRSREMFGLKPKHNANTSTLIRYDEVLAWCYVDGQEP